MTTNSEGASKALGNEAWHDGGLLSGYKKGLERQIRFLRLAHRDGGAAVVSEFARLGPRAIASLISATYNPTVWRHTREFCRVIKRTNTADLQPCQNLACLGLFISRQSPEFSI